MNVGLDFVDKVDHENVFYQLTVLNSLRFSTGYFIFFIDFFLITLSLIVKSMHEANKLT